MDNEQGPEVETATDPTLTIIVNGPGLHIMFGPAPFPIPMLFAAAKLLERQANQLLDQRDYEMAQAMERNAKPIYVPQDHLRRKGN